MNDNELQEAGEELEAAFHKTLEVLEQNGLSDDAANEFIRECEFNAWCDWRYEPSVVVDS